jgi:hypothetical protein
VETNRRLDLLVALTLLTVVALTGGCASIGTIGSAGILGLGLGVLATPVKEPQADLSAERNAVQASLSQRLLLLTGASSSVVVTIEQHQSRVTVGVFAAGRISSFVADEFIHCVRDLAWNHPDQNFATTVQDNRGRSGMVVGRDNFCASEEVRIRLGHLVPRSVQSPPVSGALIPGRLVVQRHRIEAVGDFSEATAKDFIDAARRHFPKLATSVYRDEAPQREGWKLVTTYNPPLP